jgi:hypothetical protein
MRPPPPRSVYCLLFIAGIRGARYEQPLAARCELLCAASCSVVGDLGGEGWGFGFRRAGLWTRPRPRPGADLLVLVPLVLGGWSWQLAESAGGWRLRLVLVVGGALSSLVVVRACAAVPVPGQCLCFRSALRVPPPPPSPEIPWGGHGILPENRPLPARKQNGAPARPGPRPQLRNKPPPAQRPAARPRPRPHPHVLAAACGLWTPRAARRSLGLVCELRGGHPQQTSTGRV